MKNFFSKLTKFLLILYCLLLIFNILSKKECYQSDFCAYYECAKALDAGINPYDAIALHKFSGKQLLPYAYPPITLRFFKFFTMFNYDTAFSFWLFLNILLITVLIYLWRGAFLQLKDAAAFYLFCLLAFNSSIYLGLRVGNPSILEQLMIWLAFIFYLKRKLILFCTFIVLISVLKINPILFIALVLLSEDKNKYLLFSLSLAIFGLIMLLQYLLNPFLFNSFVAVAASSLQENGIINPSSFAFIRQACFFISSILGRNLLNWVYILAYAIFVTVVLSLSGLAIALLKKVNLQDKNKWMLFIICFAYALINIRFKDYSYALLIVPAYFFIKRAPSLKAQILLFILASISAKYITLPCLGAFFYLLWGYYPFVISFFMWVLYIREIISLYKLQTVPERQPNKHDEKISRDL